MPFADLAEELATLEAQGLKRQRRILESAQGPHVRVDGRDYLAFAANDYLGLAAHPALVDAACRGAARYGVGSGASHLITGHSQAHHRLEALLAEFLGLPRALLFSTGYMANLGVVTALVGRGDVIFADRLNHASLNDAAVLSRAELVRFPHRDLAALERGLASCRGRRKLVVTDAVFSMDGDIAPLPEILALCERYDSALMVDDAHGFGVLGEHGRGVLEHFGLASERIVYMATLGKAAGVFGAFVAGADSLVETLIQRARPYIYTTAFPPLLAQALVTSLRLFVEEGWRRGALASRIAQFRACAQFSRWQLLPSQTAIQPILVGEARTAVEVASQLAARGILVPAIRPPTVPKGTARLRVSLSAAHSAEDVRRLCEALADIEALF